MEIESMFKALGEPMRCKILLLLSQRKHCTRSLAGILGITESAVSQHLKVMKDAGLISGERYGHHVHYSPVPEALDTMTNALVQIKANAEASVNGGGTCQCAMADGGTGRQSACCHGNHAHAHEGRQCCHGGRAVNACCSTEPAESMQKEK